MKLKIYLLWIVCLFSFGAMAQSHNSFDDALTITEGNNANFTVCNNNEFFLRTKVLKNGRVAIKMKSTNQSAYHGYVYIYVFDGRRNGGRLLGSYVQGSSIAPGAVASETFSIPGLLGDSLFVKAVSSQCFNSDISYTVEDIPANDAEPNNDFSQAVSIAPNTIMKGIVNYYKSGVADGDDYYVAVLPSNGTMNLHVKGTNRGGGNGYMYAYIYDAKGAASRQFGGYIDKSSIKKDSIAEDVIVLKGRANDTMYFRLVASLPFAYEISYSMTEVETSDAEPNATFDQAIKFSQQQTKQGIIGYYKKADSDGEDYYATKLPIDGAMKIYIQGINRDSRSGYMYLYGYDERKAAGQRFGKYIGTSSIAPGQTTYDTITVYGQLADSFYLKLISSAAFVYSIKYEMVQETESEDPEPNNSFATATSLTPGVSAKSRIQYTSGGVTDVDDYFKAPLPGIGTMRVIVNGINKSSSSGYMYIYIHDSRQAAGRLLGDYVQASSIVPNGSAIDTFYVYGRLEEMHYLRVTASQPFNYTIQYDLVNPQVADAESNDLIANAIILNEGAKAFGNIGYAAGASVDGNDYYKLHIEQNGSLRIPFNAVNNGNSNGYVYVKVYDQRGMAGQVFAGYMKASSIKPNESLEDTILIKGTAAGDYYLNITSAGSFGYSFEYAVTDVVPQEPEANGSFATADTLLESIPTFANIGYRNGTGTGTDADDFYVLQLRENGTLTIAVNGRNKDASNGYMYMYVYNAKQGAGRLLGVYIQSSSIGVEQSIKDTFRLKGMAAGTYYIQMTSTKAFSYDVAFLNDDVIPQDPEPNDNFTLAYPVPVDSIMNGNIGYINTATDNDDYYAGYLPEYGTLRIIIHGKNNSSSNGYLYTYGYDGRKQSGQLFGRYAGTSSIAPGAMTVDTILVNCRAVDSFFYRVISSTSFSYWFKYEMINSSVPEKDTNNTFATATALPINTILPDNIGYATKGISDGDDYFVTRLSSKGSIGFIVNATNTSPSNGYLYAYLYEKRNNTNASVGAKYLGGSSSQPAGKSFTDTIWFNCASYDTVYLRMTSSGCWKYNIRPIFIGKEPLVDIQYTRLGNEFGFRADQTNVQAYTWKFSDNTTSTSAAPFKVFVPGSYNVQLIGTNDLCKFTDTATVSFDVFGVEYFTPNKSATGGDGIMTVYGGGLDETVQIKLTRNGKTLVPTALNGNGKKNVLTANFDFHFAETGVYNVSILLPGKDTLSYANAFTITPFEYPYTTASVLTPTRWRTNQDGILKVTVENHGSVVANGVRLAVAWPKDVELEWPEDLKPPKTGIDSVPDGKGGWYTVPRKNLSFIYDTLDTNIPITELEGKPYDGFIRYFFLPHIPANKSIEVPVKARASSTGFHDFVAFTNAPNVFGSCNTEAMVAAEDLMQGELLDYADEFADKAKVPVFTAFVKTAKVGRKHMGSVSSYYGKKFWAWYDGYEFDGDAAMADLIRETEANNKYALETLVKETGGYVGGKALGSANKAIESRVKNINSTLARNPNLSPERFDKYLDILNSTNDQSKRVEILEKMFTTTKDFDKALTRAQALEAIAKDCPELKPQLEDLKKNIENEYNHQNTTRNKGETRNSWDPNAIYGPDGFNTSRYVNVSDIQHFTIAFENVDTASADAQIVVIKDTIDKAKFDLSTFEFGGITVGEEYFKLPAGRQEFVLDRQLNDSIQLRIQGKMDTASGEATWIFTSLDVNTGLIPGFAGFLPPNVSKPEGEGSVDYKVKPLSTLPHLTNMTSKALIYFDDNAPISTGTWQNIIDRAAPSSNVTGTRVNDTTINLHFTGLDNNSGVNAYNVFVKRNNGEWLKISRLESDTMWFSGSMDSTYAFYVIAEDSVRNIENKNPVAEYSTTLNNVLPVNMISFKGVAASDANLLTWSTATESNNQGFYLQKSNDGRNFSNLAFVPSKATAGNSRAILNYQFADSNYAQLTYYRLIQVDLNGRSATSNTVLLQRQVNKGFSIAPNPASNYIIISTETIPEQVKLLDMQGRTIRLYKGNTTNRYDFPQLPTGIYLVQVQLHSQTYTQRLSIH